MAFERFKRKRKPVLDHGFTLFGDRLTSQIQQRRGRAPQVSVRPTDSVCRSIYYAPDMAAPPNQARLFGSPSLHIRRGSARS